MKKLFLIAVILAPFGCKNKPLAPRKPVISKVNSVGIKMIKIPGGMFLMGHPEHRAPVHRVILSPFWISSTEVTNLQYEAVVKGHRRSTTSPGDQDPVNEVDKNDAQEFCRKLSKLEGRSYQIPTDAQWEYAARGGLEQQDYPWGNRYTFGMANSGINGVDHEIMKVATYPPNGFGLYDMAGNVAEWILDGEVDLPKSVGEQIATDPIVKDLTDAWKDQGGSWNTRGGSAFNWYPQVWFVDPQVRWDDKKSVFEDCGIRIVMIEKVSK